MGEGGSCSLPSQDVLTSPPAFPPSDCSVPGSEHLDKRALLLPRSPSCSFLPSPRGASVELWFTPRSWGHTNPAGISKLLPAPQAGAPAIPRDGDTLWWHIKITWSIWDLQCFSKLAHLFYSKLRLNLILVQELPPQQTVLKIASILQGSLSGLSVSLLATEFSVP